MSVQLSARGVIPPEHADELVVEGVKHNESTLPGQAVHVFDVCVGPEQAVGVKAKLELVGPEPG